MPKVISWTPEWLAKPNPGHTIFTNTSTTLVHTHSASFNGLDSSIKRAAKPGPRRTIACRGSEIFVAVGKEIRWADLIYLKDAFEHKQSRNGRGKGKKNEESQFDGDHAQGYRTIKTQVSEDIRQLIISPNADFIAVLTTHTVHISILPNSSQLTAPDSGPLKLKTYTLGPTTHITTQSGVTSALWHPLGVNGTCLVTVTEDAVVRVWEISVTDRWSFDKPSLAIDLKKLADGTSVDQDFSASASGTNRGFSPDSFEMEVASACFGGRGSGGWSPMTLWIAMREGDIYALCPLLPDKWSPPPTLIPALSVSIVAKVAAVEDDPEISDQTKTLAQQQLAWMSEIDAQVPTQVETSVGDPPADVYLRPSKPGRVPKLQGPFDLDLAPEESEDDPENLLTDIFFIGPKIDSEELMFGEEDELEMDDVDQEGLSLGVLCTLANTGRLSIYLDLDGVEAQWLPKTKSKAFRLLDEIDPPSLLTFEVVDTLRDSEAWEGNWPVFSQDVTSRYIFYVTDTSTVSSISLTPWVFRLENELKDTSVNADFRIDLLTRGDKSSCQRLHTQPGLEKSAPLAAGALVSDPDLGYFLLTATPYGPISLTFQAPDTQNDLPRAQSESRSDTDEGTSEGPLVLCEPRPVYEPAHEFDEGSAIPAFLARLGHSKYKRLLSEEVRLSPATLQIMTDAHKVISEETHRIGTAAAEVFRRCERLQIELRIQIQKAHEVAARVEAVTVDDDESVDPILTRNEAIERRIQAANEKQKKLTERIEAMRQRVSKGMSRELSDKERAWVEEVKILETKVIGEGVGDERIRSSAQWKEKYPWARYEEALDLNEELLEQVKALELKEEPETILSSVNVKVPADIRKAKYQQIMNLLERETALVDGAKNRLERLTEAQL